MEDDGGLPFVDNSMIIGDDSKPNLVGRTANGKKLGKNGFE